MAPTASACVLVDAPHHVASIAYGPSRTSAERRSPRGGRSLGMKVCITADQHDGVPHARLLSELGARLPRLTHQVVLGSPQPGQLSFHDEFESREPERAAPDADPIG
jgi:hypothetical protein